MLLRQVYGLVIKEERKRQLLTIRDLHELSHVSIGYISNIENGRKEPSSEVIDSLCEALCLELDVFLLRSAKKIRDLRVTEEFKDSKPYISYNRSRPAYPEYAMADATK